MKTSRLEGDRLYQLIAEVFGTTPDILSEESSAETLANWDSLNHLNLVMALESEFSVELSAEESIKMRNVAQIRKILRDHRVEL